jgi:hypothetical protein
LFIISTLSISALKVATPNSKKIMATIYNNLRNEKKLKAVTGMNVKEFDVLLSCFQKHYIPKQKNTYTDAHSPVLTDLGGVLFFFPHYHKTYPTLENMGLYFDIDVKTVCKYLDYIKAPLRAALRGLGTGTFGPFGPQEELDKAFEGVEGLVVDCTEVPVQRPSDPGCQGFMYPGKKSHTVKILVASTRACRARYRSGFSSN